MTKTLLIGWWPSYPREPINGVMVSDHFKDPQADHLAEDGKTLNPWPLPKGHVHPESLRETLAGFRVHPQELDGETLRLVVHKAAEIDQTKDKRLLSVAKIIAEAASVQAAATYVMQQTDWDFTAVYFDAIDHFCHGFMRYHPPRLSWVNEADFALYKEVVNSGYRFHDMMLGVLLDLAGPDTNVLICSDHGFHPDHLRVQEIPNEPAGPADEHRHFGVFAACGPGFKRDELVFGATLLDITPTILRLHDLPVGEDMDGRALLQALAEPKPMALIPSWDAVPGDDGCHPEDVRIDPVDARESLQQLVDLGYIEDVNEDRKQAGTNQATFAWLKGRLLAAERRHGEALVQFQQAEQVQMHNRPSLFQAQGEALLAMRRFTDAEARFRKVLEIDPVNADGSLGLARARSGRARARNSARRRRLKT